MGSSASPNLQSVLASEARLFHLGCSSGELRTNPHSLYVTGEAIGYPVVLLLLPGYHSDFVKLLLFVLFLQDGTVRTYLGTRDSVYEKCMFRGIRGFAGCTRRLKEARIRLSVLTADDPVLSCRSLLLSHAESFRPPTPLLPATQSNYLTPASRIKANGAAFCTSLIPRLDSLDHSCEDQKCKHVHHYARTANLTGMKRGGRCY